MNYTDPFGEQQVGGGRVLDQPMRDVGGGGGGGSGAGAQWIKGVLDWFGRAGDKITRGLRGGQSPTPYSPLPEVFRKFGSGGPTGGPEFPPQMFLPDPCAPPQVSREAFPPSAPSNSGSVTEGLPETQGDRVGNDPESIAKIKQSLKEHIIEINKQYQEEQNAKRRKGINVALGMWSTAERAGPEYTDHPYYENPFYWYFVDVKRCYFLGLPNVNYPAARNSLALGLEVFFDDVRMTRYEFFISEFIVARTLAFLRLKAVKRIYFEISYIEKSARSSFGGPGYYARREMESILKDPKLFKKTSFYERGRPIGRSRVRRRLVQLGFFKK